MRNATKWSMIVVMCLTSSLLAIDTTQLAEKAPQRNAALLYWQAFAMLPELSEAEDEVVSDARTAPMDETVAAIVKKAEPSLKLLRRGARCNKCDWEIDKADGVEAIMPHLSKGRSLVRLAILRARYNFSQDKPREAVEDLAAALTFGRHVGHDGPMIAMLVQIAIDSFVIEQAAHYVTSLSPESLKLLDERLAAMPPAPDMATMLRGESGILPLQKDHPQYEQAVSLYRELAKIAHLPPDEFEKKAKALYGKFPKILLPSMINVVQTHAAGRSMTAMLTGVVAALRAGDEAKLKSIKDPYGDGPFAYTKTKKGFELRGKARVRGKAVKLEFPMRKRRATSDAAR